MRAHKLPVLKYYLVVCRRLEQKEQKKNIDQTNKKSDKQDRHTPEHIRHPTFISNEPFKTHIHTAPTT